MCIYCIVFKRFKHGRTVRIEFFYNKLYEESRKHILMDDYVIQGKMSAALGNILCLMKFFFAIVVDFIEKHRVTSGAYSSE